jgi:hypothetical protein
MESAMSRKAEIKQFARRLYDNVGTMKEAREDEVYLEELMLYTGSWGLGDWMDGKEPHLYKDQFNKWLFKKIEAELDALYEADSDVEDE